MRARKQNTVHMAGLCVCYLGRGSKVPFALLTTWYCLLASLLGTLYHSAVSFGFMWLQLPLMSACLSADEAMRGAYGSLASRLSAQLASRSAPLWIAIAGGPGAGKSTLAARVSALLNEAEGSEVSVVLPMDGFHYSRAQLSQLDPPDASEFLPRRGAPWTFDAEGLYAALLAAKQEGEATLPTYR